MYSMIKRCVSVILFSSLFLVHVQAEDNLEAWWTMDEVDQNGKIADATTNGLDLTLGSGCWITNGITGPALHFNGTADAWSNFSGPAMGSRTVSLLFRRDVENGPIYPQGVSTWPYIITALSTMNIHLATANDSNLVYVKGRPMSGLGSIIRGQWNHLAWVYEETPTGEPDVVTANSKLYVNGVLNGTSPTLTITNTSATGTTYLGNHSNKSRPIYGELDEVKIYSAALTEAEVMQEALRARETNKIPQLLGHWIMEEIEDVNGLSVVRDVSGNGYDLQLDTGCKLTNGVDGSALYFDGTQDASANFTNYSAISSWSFASWVRLDRASAVPIVSGNYYPRIMQGSYSLMVHLRYDTDYMTFQSFGHTGSQNKLVQPDNGVWAHYAVTTRMAYDEANSSFSSIPVFYVNGQKVGEGLEKLTDRLVWNPSYKIYLGNAALNSVRPFYGEFDDFRFYDGVLSEDQVKEIYQGLPSVSAGSDFTNASDTVTLQGSVGDANDCVLRSGSSLELTWSLVSAPAGGESASIVTPGSAVTQASLPVVGDYVFRLTAENYAHSSSDEVTITRVAAPGGNVAPSVTLDATASVTLPAPLSLDAVVSDSDSVLGTVQVLWTKVSGPGGVYFDDATSSSTTASFLSPGSYVLRCTADDGADTGYDEITVTVTGDSTTLSLTNGLVRYYPMNSMPINEEVISGSTAMTYNNLEAGIVGYGLRSYNANGYANTQLALPEYGEDENTAVTNPTHLAFSLWMYHDTSDTNVTANAAPAACQLQYGALLQLSGC